MAEMNNLKIVEIAISGTDDIRINISDFFGFLMEIKTRAQDAINGLPEFKQKRKQARIVFVMRGIKTNKKVDPNVEKEIEIDIGENVKEVNDYGKIQETIINAAVDALKKELPSIEASLADPEPDLDTEKKRPWWKFW